MISFILEIIDRPYKTEGTPKLSESIWKLTGTGIFLTSAKNWMQRTIFQKPIESIQTWHPKCEKSTMGEDVSNPKAEQRVIKARRRTWLYEHWYRPRYRTVSTADLVSLRARQRWRKDHKPHEVEGICSSSSVCARQYGKDRVARDAGESRIASRSRRWTRAAMDSSVEECDEGNKHYACLPRLSWTARAAATGPNVLPGSICLSTFFTFLSKLVKI